MTPTEHFNFRPATLDDAPTIARHRRSMFRDMGHDDEPALDSMSARFLPWLEAKIRANQYLGWFAAVDGGRVVAGAGLWLMDWPPHLLGSSPQRGNIVNVYTEPEFRRRGLARRLMEIALDWCKANRIDFVILHASDEGRPLYESMGFTASNEMRIKLHP